jgi:hypothetical protein
MRRVATGFTENSEKLTAKFTKLCAKSTKEFATDFTDYTEKLTAKVAKLCAKNTKKICTILH